MGTLGALKLGMLGIPDGKVVGNELGCKEGCWLGKELGYRRPSDWYVVEHRHFKETGGAALLDAYYGNSKIRAVRERYPNYRWNASRFQNAGYRK